MRVSKRFDYHGDAPTSPHLSNSDADSKTAINGYTYTYTYAVSDACGYSVPDSHANGNSIAYSNSDSD